MPRALMDASAFSEIFPLFNAASSETLEWFLAVAEEQQYAAGEAIVAEEDWGNAVHFIASGWVEIRRRSEQGNVTLALLGRSDFFGESAILDEPLRGSDAIALYDTCVLSVSAQRFIQTLFRDIQLHHKLLQLMVRRLRECHTQAQLNHQPPTVKLAYLLTTLAERCGIPTEEGTAIFHASDKAFADLADIDCDETRKAFAKFQQKGWVELDGSTHTLYLTNLKQLSHLAGGL